LLRELTKGQVRSLDIHERTGTNLCIVEGKDLDGHLLQIVIDPSGIPTIRVITAIYRTR